MKKQDFRFLLLILLIFLPFLFSSELYNLFLRMSREHGVVMSFLKFAVLSTLGESLGLRITRGIYNYKGFGLFPRAIVWGVLGIGINFAMIIFSGGVPALLTYCGLHSAHGAFLSPDLSVQRIFTAFMISFFMNAIFAPLFMTFHKITDMHILSHGGRLSSLLKPIDMGASLASINWNVQWNFVFKKTIPFFWIPAHTVTFLLPPEIRVLFAALLGVILGLILAVAARKADSV